MFLSDLKELNQTESRFMTQELDRNQCIPWASLEIFPGRGNVEICSSFSGCWQCNANGYSQNALPFLPISLCWL